MKRVMIALVLMPLLGASVAVAKDVTLTLYVHAGSPTGPVLTGALVTCKDAAGKSLSGVTSGSGLVTLTGTPGTWQLIASKEGYRAETWSQAITAACTRHAFLQPMAPPPSAPAPQPPAQPPTPQRQPAPAQTEARTPAAPAAPAPAPAAPAPPTLASPGGASEPGPVIGTLTPTLQWTAVPGATSYAVGISKYPYGTANLVWNPQVVTGTSLQVPAGVLLPGMKYRWNLQARSATGQLSPLSSTLYFQTAAPPTAAPAASAAVPTPAPAAQPPAATTAPSAPPTSPSPTGAPSAPAPQTPTVATLKLYVHAGSAAGSVLQGVRVTGKDGAGKQFNQTTDASGCATTAGAPGTWQLVLSMNGYQGLAGTIAITASGTAHLVLTPLPPALQPAAPAPSQPNPRPQVPAASPLPAQATPASATVAGKPDQRPANQPTVSQEQIERAVQWAKGMLGKTGYQEICLVFAQDAYKGLVLGPWGDAATAASGMKAKGELNAQTEPPAGAWVFYNNPKDVRGHVALFVGNGKIIHPYTSRGTTVITEHPYAGVPGVTYIGWAWPRGPQAGEVEALKAHAAAQAAPVARPGPSGAPLPSSDASRTLAEIQRKIRALPAYPQYLHGTNAGLRGAIADAAAQVANRQRLDEYDRWYQAALNYRGLAQVQLIRAERFTHAGKVEEAQRFLQDSDRCVKLYYLANDAAISVYSAGVEKAAYYAKAVYETSRAAFVLTSSAAGLGPVASVLADHLYTATDFAVNTSEMGLSKAAKQAVIDVMAQEVGKEMVKELAGTGLKGAGGAKPTVGLKDLLTRLARDNSFCTRVLRSVAQGTSQELSTDLVSKLMSDVAVQASGNP